MSYPATEVPGLLRQAGSVTLDASGNGVIILQPSGSRQRWEVTSVVVSTNQAATATTVPVATVALNTISAATLSQSNNYGATWSGNQDVFQGTMQVGAADFLSVIFSPPPGNAGTALTGVIARATVTGTRYTWTGS